MFDVDRLDFQAMESAIEVAKFGARQGHRPFGCIVFDPGGGWSVSAYGTESSLDPTRHSEIVAIKAACKRNGGLLNGCTLVSTHEPCPMCAGAITHSKLSRVVFGSYRRDLPELFRAKPVAATVLRDTSHPPEVVGGVRRGACIHLFDEELRQVSGVGR